MSRSIHFAVAFFVLLLVVNSCKKGTNNNPFGTSKIATIDHKVKEYILHYHYFYDAYNNVDSVSITGSGTAASRIGYYKFHYFGSSYSITDETNFTYTVYASTSGLILKVLVVDTLSYIYNNSQLSEISQDHVSSVPPYQTKISTYYNWTSGDVMTTTSGGQNEIYTYDMSKNGQPGDAFRITQFMSYGRVSAKTIHLPVSLNMSATQGIKYLYEFDNAGRITSLKEATYDTGLGSKDTTSYSYTYY